jgi:hypothetical protein
MQGVWPSQSLFESSRVHRDSNSQKWELIWECESSFSHCLTLLLACALVNLCLGHEPKARVATMLVQAMMQAMDDGGVHDTLVNTISTRWQKKLNVLETNTSSCFRPM